MHTYISAFPRDRFHNGLLQDGVTVGQRSIKGIDKPLLFWDTRGRSHESREKDFIVFSCVRSNDHSKVGFVSDRRRMNVALTRAKYGLISVGDLWCLTAGSLDWRDYLSNLKKQKFVHEGKKFKY
ncbi:hypothetical protein DASC09_029150 [Saccharomycopsis crataegensis]|nr:hypothetical protein DASC09_029150 [Saccharomycopsis crataegensis]